MSDLTMHGLLKNHYEYELIEEYILTGPITSYDFTSISSDYKQLKVEGSLSVNAANGGSVAFIFNDDNASSNYQTNGWYLANSTNLYESSLTSNFINLRYGVAYSAAMSHFTAEIFNNSGEYKTFQGKASSMADASTFGSSTKFGSWNNTGSLINKITVDLPANTETGFIRLYGRR